MTIGVLSPRMLAGQGEPPEPIRVWTTGGVNAGTLSINDICFGNGLFVAVGIGAANTAVRRIITSPDGITWTAITGIPDYNLTGVTYGNGLFVAVGYTVADSTVGAILTSPDSVTWTVRTPVTTSFPPRKVAYNNGLFVIVGGDPGTGGKNSIQTSPNGITWTTRAAPNTFTGYFNSVIAVAGGFVVNGTTLQNATTGSGAGYSTNGTIWARSLSGSTTNGIPGTTPHSVNGPAGIILTETTGSVKALSVNNGATFTRYSSNVANNYRIIAANSQYYVALSSTTSAAIGVNSLAIGTNGLTYELLPLYQIAWNCICYGNGRFVAIGGSGSGSSTRYAVCVA